MASDEQRAYRAKLASLGLHAKPKATKTTAVIDDTTGRHAGEQIEHKDGHVDAVVRPQVVQIQGKADR